MSIAKLAILAALAATAGATPALAQMTETRTASVSTKGLDLINPQDVEILRRRVRNAVSRVCNDALGEDLALWEGYVSCTRESARAANARVALAINSAKERQQRIASSAAAREIANK